MARQIPTRGAVSAAAAAASSAASLVGGTARYPGASAPGLARGPQSFTRIFRAHDSDTAQQWNRLDLAFPALVFPYRSEEILPIATDIGFLHLSYSQGFPYTQSTEVPALPAGYRGSVYCWAPGTWWVRVVTGMGGAVNVPMVIQPVDGATMSFATFARYGGRTSVTRATGLATPTDTKFFSAQEMVVATGLEIYAEGTMYFRWEEPVAGGADFFVLGAGSGRIYSGELLPLADLYGHSNSATTKIITFILHYD